MKMLAGAVQGEFARGRLCWGNGGGWIRGVIVVCKCLSAASTAKQSEVELYDTPAC